MKKKIVPVLVVLALVVVGVGGYFLGREFSTSPSLETPPAQSSTPAEPTPEVKNDAAPEANPVADVTPENDLKFTYYADKVQVIQTLAKAYAIPDEASKGFYFLLPDEILESAEISSDGKWVRAANLGSIIYTVANNVKIVETIPAAGEIQQAPKVEMEAPQVVTGQNDSTIPQDTTTGDVDYNEPLDNGDWSNDTIPDYLQNIINPEMSNPDNITEGSGIEGGHIGDGPGGYIDENGKWVVPVGPSSGSGYIAPLPRPTQPQPSQSEAEKPAEEPKVETPKVETPKQESNSGIPDYLLNNPNNVPASKVTEGSGIEGGHVGDGPGDDVSWNN